MSIYIREAEDDDVLEILGLLKDFANSSTIEYAGDIFYPPSVAGMIKYSMVNGCCIVAMDGDKMIGTMIGAIGINPWTMHSREMKEVAWWVDPEYRTTKAGIMLFRRYVSDSKEMIEEGIIKASFMTTLDNSGEGAEKLVSKYFRKLETHYIMGG